MSTSKQMTGTETVVGSRLVGYRSGLASSLKIIASQLAYPIFHHQGRMKGIAPIMAIQTRQHDGGKQLSSPKNTQSAPKTVVSCVRSNDKNCKA
jgi:hypothetical protein